MMETAKNIALIIAGILLIGLMQERDAAHDRESHMRFVRESCVAQRPNEAALSKIGPGGKIECAIFTNYGYGRAPVLLSAATVEAPR